MCRLNLLEKVGLTNPYTQN